MQAEALLEALHRFPEPRWLRHRYVPDARRHFSTQPDRGLSLVMRKMEY